MSIRIGNKNKIKNSTIISGNHVDAPKDTVTRNKPDMTFWQTVLANVLSNLIWWIIGTIILLVICCLAIIKWEDIMTALISR